MQFISVRLMSDTLFTVSEGQLGICWGDVHEGDVMTLLEGASAPVVLRKTGEGYIYVAPAYAAGIMNGEAWDNDPVVDEYVTGLIDGEGYKEPHVILNNIFLTKVGCHGKEIARKQC
jgi:hypothetical protein